MSYSIILPFVLFSITASLPEKSERSIGLFDFVTFPNDVCFGDGSVQGHAGQLSGNCYTKQECDVLGGTAAGDCAEGYGVCCVLRPACGETVKQNLSYLIQEETTSPPEVSCFYKICPESSDVNRIRLDFTRFVIGGPFSLDATQSTGAATNAGNIQNAVGQCVDDTFVVTSTGRGSPVICGVNNGQHMVVDTDGEKCVTASFVFGLSGLTREYEIRVLQYSKQNELGGPQGCLQFLVDERATVSSFNWASGVPRTHLSNQNYDICIRRLRGRCGICWTQEATTFGLSVSTDANVARSETGTNCITDFIVIPNGVSVGDAMANTIQIGNSKYCGRFLNPARNIDTHDTVCSLAIPFKLTVVTNTDEQFTTGATQGVDNNEALQTPLGTQGFSLTYDQRACPGN